MNTPRTPRRLGGFPPTMEAPLNFEPGTSKLPRPVAYCSAYAPLSFNRVLLFRKWGRLRKQRNLGLQLIFVLLECHPHQLPSGAHSGLLEKTLQNRLHITLGDL